LDGGAQKLHKLRIPGAREFVAKLEERGLTAPHNVGITGDESHDDNALEKRTQDGSHVGARAPSHFSDADHAQEKGERHEQHSDFAGGAEEIVEHGLRSRLEDQDSAR
jgi:hypothetical protein